MTLIRLECENLNRCVRTFVISVIEMWIYWWLEDQSWLIGWKNWSLIIDILKRWSIVPDYSTWIDTWCSWWLLKLWAGRFTSIVFSTNMRFRDGYVYETVYWLEVSRLLLYYSCYWKLLGQDCLTVTPCTVLLFIVYTVTVTVHCYWYCLPCIRLLTVTVLLSLLSPYRPSILGNMDIDWLNWIK